MRTPMPFRPLTGSASLLPARTTLDRVAILGNSGQPSRSSGHLIGLLAEQWRQNGIEVIELTGPSRFVEADLLLLHLSRPLVPEDYRRFAAQYPVTFNAGATDLRKNLYADGLLKADAAYRAPVIVKPVDRYASMSSARPASRGVFGFRPRAGTAAAASNDNARIYSSLADVPAEKFSADYIVQKFVPEEQNGRYALRQYFFLGDRHFISLQTSGAAIIHSSAPLSLDAWTPPQVLLDLRAKLGLDYGRIDFVMHEGRPFVLGATRSPGLPAMAEPSNVPPPYLRLAEALAETLVETYATMEKSVF